MKWYKEIISKFKSRPPVAHMFLLHLNVNDLVLCPDNTCMNMADYLRSGMQSFRIVATYNRSAGITFLKPEMEK